MAYVRGISQISSFTNHMSYNMVSDISLTLKFPKRIKLSLTRTNNVVLQTLCWASDSAQRRRVYKMCRTGALLVFEQNKTVTD